MQSYPAFGAPGSFGAATFGAPAAAPAFGAPAVAAPTFGALPAAPTFGAPAALPTFVVPAAPAFRAPAPLPTFVAPAALAFGAPAATPAFGAPAAPGPWSAFATTPQAPHTNSTALKRDFSSFASSTGPCAPPDWVFAAATAPGWNVNDIHLPAPPSGGGLFGGLFGGAAPVFGTSSFTPASAPGDATFYGSSVQVAGTHAAAFIVRREPEGGGGTNIVSYHTISAMPEYQGKTHEELRMEDYMLGRPAIAQVFDAYFAPSGFVVQQEPAEPQVAVVLAGIENPFAPTGTGAQTSPAPAAPASWRTLAHLASWSSSVPTSAMPPAPLGAGAPQFGFFGGALGGAAAGVRSSAAQPHWGAASPPMFSSTPAMGMTSVANPASTHAPASSAPDEACWCQMIVSLAKSQERALEAVRADSARVLQQERAAHADTLRQLELIRVAHTDSTSELAQLRKEHNMLHAAHAASGLPWGAVAAAAASAPAAAPSTDVNAVLADPKRSYDTSGVWPRIAFHAHVSGHVLHAAACGTCPSTARMASLVYASHAALEAAAAAGGMLLCPECCESHGF